MKMTELLPILKQVLINPYVIGTVVVVILFMNFASFVANYRKKPPKPKVKRAAAAPAPAAAPAEGAEGGGDAGDDAGEE